LWLDYSRFISLAHNGIFLNQITKVDMNFWVKSLLVVIFFSLSCSLFASSFAEDIERAAMLRTEAKIRYDGAYVAIDYPLGDVPGDTGVCTDVVIRSYRSLGVDLQQLVHEDMLANFSLYPSTKIWGLTKPDSNIDHRRVPNLQAFFSRNGASLPVSKLANDYRTGDLVTWMLAGNLPHIGIVTNQFNAERSRPLIVHNIGRGPELSDMLFDYTITGHYRYIPSQYNQSNGELVHL
jgi:uncharacterized protein